VSPYLPFVTTSRRLLDLIIQETIQKIHITIQVKILALQESALFKVKLGKKQIFTDNLIF